MRLRFDPQVARSTAPLAALLPAFAFSPFPLPTEIEHFRTGTFADMLAHLFNLVSQNCRPLELQSLRSVNDNGNNLDSHSFFVDNNDSTGWRTMESLIELKEFAK